MARIQFAAKERTGHKGFDTNYTNRHGFVMSAFRIPAFQSFSFQNFIVSAFVLPIVTSRGLDFCDTEQSEWRQDNLNLPIKKQNMWIGQTQPM
jgi:hypothetical protein